MVGGLAAGDYFAVAVDDIDPDLILDPDAVEKLSRIAVHVTLVDGVTTALTLHRAKVPIP